MKYFVTYLTMQGKNATEADYFTGFIGGNIAPVVFMIIFMAATFFIVYNGVDKGIEKCSRILMPILFVIILIVVAFSLTLSTPLYTIKNVAAIKIIINTTGAKIGRAHV